MLLEFGSLHPVFKQLISSARQTNCDKVMVTDWLLILIRKFLEKRILLFRS